MRLIDLLLRLYPEEFRSRFGGEMREFHEQRLREPRAPRVRIVLDHLAAAVREQLHALGPDVRFALRSLASRPTFAAVVILTVALGVGANGAVFSIVNGVLLRALPYADADRAVVFGHEPPYWLVSAPQYAVYRDRLTILSSLAAFTRSEATLSTRGEAERVAVASVTRNFFSTLGVGPLLGRIFLDGEDVVRPATVVVLSHRLWTRAFAADSAAIGQTITLNGVARTVVGVMPAGFEYPDPQVQLWLPICSQRTCASLTTLAPNDADGWTSHYLFAVGRLRGRATLQDLRAQAVLVARRIMREHPNNFDASSPLTPRVTTVRDTIVGGTRPYLVALLGAVVFILLIVCANVANLLLARGTSRQRDLALRAALGASRRRLVVQVLTESVVLALIGGLIGIGLAWGGTRLLVSVAPASLPRLDQVRVDAAVVVFSMAVSFAAGIIFGVVPALRHARRSPSEVLRVAGKGIADRGGSRRTRGALVVAEIALAVVLLTGAGMLVRSLLYLRDMDIGFRPAGALTARVSLDGNAYDAAASIRFFHELLGRVRTWPGVDAAGAARWLPVIDAGGLWDIRIENKEFPPGQTPTAVPQDVTPGFFAAMGMPVLRGRDFSDADRTGAPLVAIVNATFAQRYWPEGNPLGRRFRLGSSGSAWVTVVGIVKDMQARGPGDTPEPSMYYPYAQLPQSGYYVPTTLSLVVRTHGDPLALATPIRRAVAALDRGVPVSGVRTLESVVATATDSRRFGTTVLADFAVLALLLATIGIYGVMSYSVSERTFEIGVRMALGAGRWRVLGLIVRDAARLSLTGLALGLTGAALLARGIRSMLVGVPTLDVRTMAAVAALLGVVALVATLLPARRATRVDPNEAIRTG